MSIYRSDPTIDFWQALAFETEDWRAQQARGLDGWQWHQKKLIEKRAQRGREAIEKSYQYARAYVTLSPLIGISIDAESLIRSFASLTEASERAANAFKGFGAAMAGSMRHLGIPLAPGMSVQEAYDRFIGAMPYDDGAPLW